MTSPAAPAPLSGEPDLLLTIPNSNEHVSDFRAFLPLTEERAYFFLEQMDKAERESASTPRYAGMLLSADEDPWYIVSSNYVGDQYEWDPSEVEDADDVERLGYLNDQELPIPVEEMQSLLREEEDGNPLLLIESEKMRDILSDGSQIRTMRTQYEVTPNGTRIAFVSDATGAYFRSYPFERADIITFLCRIERDPAVVASLMRRIIEVSPYRAVHLLEHGVKLTGETESRELISLLNPEDLHPLLTHSASKLRQAAMTMVHKTRLQEEKSEERESSERIGTSQNLSSSKEMEKRSR